MALGTAGVSLAGLLAASGAAAGATPDSSPGNAAASPAQAVPLQTGATQLADTVVKAMCSDFGRWCGTPRRWG